MIILLKSHPATQAMSGAAKPADLNEPGLRRNPGEPSAEQAEADTYNKPRIQWQGLTIAIENPAGSVRRGRNRHGVSWEIRMRFDYGEIVGSMGVDGDPVDVYMGPNPDAPMVYVVHQRRVNDWTEYDEDKCMVGFDSQEDAEAAFLSNYNDPRFLGPVTAMPVAEFVAKVRATKEAPAMIKAAAPVVLFFKAHVGPYLRGGKIVNVAGYQGRSARAVPQPGQMNLFGINKPLPPSPLKGKDPVAHTPDMFDTITEPRDELIKEHERLVNVLNSPSHEDDKVEAKRQAKELAEMKGEHDHLLADMPGAKFKRGKGLIAGHFGVEVDGSVIGNYHAKPEDAVAEAKQSMAGRAAAAKDKAERAEAMTNLRDRLAAGGEATDADLKLLGLKDGSSGLKWFIPAASELFGITSHAVRPRIKDLIRIGHSEMGTKLEFVNPKKALAALATGVSGLNQAGDEEFADWSNRETAPVGSWVKADYKLADSQPVYQVQKLDVDSLYLPELDSSGRLQPEKRKYLEGYTERAKAGEQAPSINVIEMENGKMRVVDGHRRVLAARAAGKKTIRALVSPLIDSPEGKKEATVELIQRSAKPLTKSIFFLRHP